VKKRKEENKSKEKFRSLFSRTGLKGKGREEGGRMKETSAQRGALLLSKEISSRRGGRIKKKREGGKRKSRPELYDLSIRNSFLDKKEEERKRRRGEKRKKKKRGGRRERRGECLSSWINLPYRGGTREGKGKKGEKKRGGKEKRLCLPVPSIISSKDERQE